MLKPSNSHSVEKNPTAEQKIMKSSNLWADAGVRKNKLLIHILNDVVESKPPL